MQFRFNGESAFQAWTKVRSAIRGGSCVFVYNGDGRCFYVKSCPYMFVIFKNIYDAIAGDVLVLVC